jgi:hypothetical protein
MNIEQQVVKALWQEPSRKIETGVPVYFDFTRDKLDEIFYENHIPCADSLELVRLLLSRHLGFESNKVSILDTIYEPHSIGVSSCILMICLQVLAVEDMVKSDNFSENAYFPRFRKLLSSTLSDAEQNPFSPTAIESVWRRISDEIGNKDLVTFSLEKISGVNRSRHFPLIQALLCGEDVLKILSALNPSKKICDDSIGETLDKKNLNLTFRGKRLVTLPWLRPEIYRQVLFAKSNSRFLDFLESQVRIKEKISLDYEIAICWDSSEWLKEEYVISCIEKNNQQQVSPHLIKDILKNLDAFYIALAPSEFQDCWIAHNNLKIISLGQTVFIVYLETNKEKVEALINKIVCTGSSNIEYGVFQRFVKIGFCKLEIIAPHYTMTIDKGKLAVGGKENPVARQVDFIGGIAVNSQRDRFDCFNLPTSVRHLGVEFPLIGIVEVNSRRISFDLFRESVRGLSKHEDFEMVLNQNIKFKLKVAARDSRSEESLSHPLNSVALLPCMEVMDLELLSSLSALELYEKYDEVCFFEFCDSLRIRQQYI